MHDQYVCDERKMEMNVVRNLWQVLVVLLVVPVRKDHDQLDDVLQVVQRLLIVQTGKDICWILCL